ncbi:breast cancer suppressor candidate 1,bcsc-1 [Tritrichomonas foetus]|uniref:Breast cancer suppressor candidate 1,bcsc-1 n=1 Tax=Tritrichomonas foetus TaxID=1144522 RepID=A0A1J4KNR6_9EUKA|nr:breast cancer suppressor candidate 1,bcsc-1 [Tritrichomonas foetus]|eukprot:OHT11061.1 breast cancer suppressor candidate 1,bcsc-1 [Tritrichomonas foetus]
MIMFLISLFALAHNYIELRAAEHTGNITLQNLAITTNIIGNIAQTNYELKYYNNNNDTIKDSTLYLPHVANLAISDVIMATNGTIYLSKAFENPEAQQEFQKHVEKGDVTLLVKQNYDSIQIDLANIPSKENITIQFSAVQTLKTNFDFLSESFLSKFQIPMTMKPIYHPSNNNLNNNNNDKGDAPLESSIPYNFVFKLMAPNAKRIEFPTYPNVKIDQDKKCLVYNGPLEKDISVNLYFDSVNEEVNIEKYNGTQITQFLLSSNTYRNLVEDKNVFDNKSIVFLIDRSGSMYGSEQFVKNALELFLHSLPANSQFEIVGFGSTYEPLFNQLRNYDETSLHHVLNSINQIVDPNLGGTEIYQPLKYILEKLKPDIVILLTDGAVSNDEEIIQLSTNYSTTISSLGIGNMWSAHLLQGLAFKTGGSYEIISNAEEIKSSVIRLLYNSLYLYLNDIEIETNCGQLMSENLKSIKGNEMISLLFYNSKEIKEGYLTIKGKIPINKKEAIFKNYSISYNLTKANIQEDKILHKIATITLEDNDSTNNKEQIIQLSKRLNLLTKHTSLLLYDNSHENFDEEKMKLKEKEIIGISDGSFPHSRSLRGYHFSPKVKAASFSHMIGERAGFGMHHGLSFSKSRINTLLDCDDSVAESMEVEDISMSSERSTEQGVQEESESRQNVKNTENKDESICNLIIQNIETNGNVKDAINLVKTIITKYFVLQENNEKEFENIDKTQAFSFLYEVLKLKGGDSYILVAQKILAFIKQNINDQNQLNNSLNWALNQLLVLKEK